MEIKVLGPGCKKCGTLAEAAKKAVEELAIDANITKVDDMVKILSYGVMSTPALVINEKVVVSGKVPSVSEIKEFIQNA
ncbi:MULTISPECIES: thioredoxin family protein [Labilibaculum]|uniref:Thioredoxin family protein n=2 Tax=Labilibaculum TaxID=2060722 RepID=A0A7M4D3D8_9BACT|nr:MULTISPECIES: thioredoxin family protein [Labilibaculum]MUP37167.1 thioredoxin family protein [Labilibaculum euxinus]MVB06372.1 thioredoxin family protein [Labilibaculum euxinus]PKQ67334.1 redox-active disulfide protein 2 [Labilibaculum manganireducens]